MKKRFDLLKKQCNISNILLELSQDSGETILLSSKITRLDTVNIKAGFSFCMKRNGSSQK
jgi:hypothetical protein